MTPTTKPSQNVSVAEGIDVQSSGRHGHPRKRRKIESFSDATTSFPRNTTSDLRESDDPNEHLDLENSEMKNGESIAALRRMVLGKVEYKASQTVPGKYLALDCEMVGIGIDGEESSLARVSVVNYAGAIILDAFVRQRERVVDYRTKWSGIRSADLGSSAKPFNEVQQTVADMIKDRILVGHAVYNDLKSLLLSHPSPQLRDTQSLAFKHRVVKSRRPALRVLVKQELDIVIQGGEHSSVTDARATMAIFRLHKKQWESGFRPIRSLAHSPSKSKGQAGDESANTTSASSNLSKKRKRPERSGFDTNVSKMTSSSLHPRAQSPTQHISTSPKHRKQKSIPRPPGDSEPRKGISSGISTVVRRADGGKEIQGNGARTKDGIGAKGGGVRSNSKGGKNTETGVGKWWTSLGGDKKGTLQ